MLRFSIYRFLPVVFPVALLLAQPRSATFFEPRQFPAGMQPVSAVVADFNHDGRPDVAVAGGSDGVVSILINNGDGFAAPVGYPSGSHAKAIVSGDFNGDGNPDLAVVGGAGFVYILLGNRDGTFGAATAVALPASGTSLAAGNFTGHGTVDLAIAAGEVLVLPGHGDGTFGTPIRTKTGYGAAQLAAGDLNNDGKLDLVVRTVESAPYEPPSQLVSLLGNGDGTFQPFQIVYPGYYAPVPYLYDLNGDGFADLVEDGVAVQLGNGDGTFQPATGYLVDGDTSPTFADVNGDGHVDIITTGSNSVSILPGNGNGTFGHSYSYAANLGAVWVGVAHFLGTGAEDIVVLNQHGSVSLIPGSSGGNFRAQRTVDFDQPLNGQVLADFNGDGILDVALLGVGSVQVLLGTGGGEFTRLTPAKSGPYPISLATGDFNGDGIPDLAVTGQNTNSLNVLLGKGDGTFATGGSYAVPPSSYLISAGALRNSGATSLIVLGAGSAYDSSVAEVLPGNGRGGFGAPLTIVSSPYFLSNFVLGDFNGDGNLDVAFSEFQGGGPGVELYLGNGDGTFRPPLYPYPHGALNLAVGDFNGDGKPDLALLGAVDGGELLILLGNGDGTFQQGQAIPSAPTASFNFLSADLNGDGIPDLVADNGGNEFSVYLGKGDGTFTLQPTRLPCVGGGCEASVGDLNGDGKLDLIFSQLSDGPLNMLSVLINTTP